MHGRRHGNGRAYTARVRLRLPRCSFGLLERELWGKGKMFRGAIAPQFFMSNGSEARVSHASQQAVFKMTEAVTCTKCKHQHLLEPPSLEVSVADLENVKVSAAAA